MQDDLIEDSPTNGNPLYTKMAFGSIKVLIVDDHYIFRLGLKTLLKNYAFLKLKGEAANGNELKKLMEFERPDLIFMDLNMPGTSGAECTAEILKEYPFIKIIIISSHDDAITVERLMRMGALAFLTKNVTQGLLDEMFEKVLKGSPYISPDAANNVAMKKILSSQNAPIPLKSQWLADEITHRERQVLKMITCGLSQKQIAAELLLSARTIETHKEKLMKKLGAKNLAELISIAHEYQLL